MKQLDSFWSCFLRFFRWVQSSARFRTDYSSLLRESVLCTMPVLQESCSFPVWLIGEQALLLALCECLSSFIFLGYSSRASGNFLTCISWTVLKGSPLQEFVCSQFSLVLSPHSCEIHVHGLSSLSLSVFIFIPHPYTSAWKLSSQKVWPFVGLI